jgi:hypothetical protein
MAELDQDFTDEETEHLDPNIRAELRKSRERAREAEAAKAEADQLRRELAFTKAGIPEEGVGKLFRKAYEGETDPAAIIEAAREYGITGQATQQTETVDAVREELEQHRAIVGATGTNASGPTQEQELLAAIQQGNSVEEVMQVINQMGNEAGLFAPGTR